LFCSYHQLTRGTSMIHEDDRINLHIFSFPLYTHYVSLP
jgi:hypothetical protein